MTTGTGCRRGRGRRFERNDLERHSQHLRHFLGKPRTRLGFDDVVRRAAQRATDHLFAEQLTLKWTQSDHVRDRVGIPPFSEHADTHNAANVAARGMQRSFEFRRQRLEVARIHRSRLRVARPVTLTNRIERETHPAHQVTLRPASRLAVVRFADDLGINANCMGVVLVIAH